MVEIDRLITERGSAAILREHLMLPYSCRCGVSVDFTGRDLKSIRGKLP